MMSGCTVNIPFIFSFPKLKEEINIVLLLRQQIPFFIIYLFISTSSLEYNCFAMLLVSAAYQSESAVRIHIPPYPLPLVPPSHPPYPTPLGGHKALS